MMLGGSHTQIPGIEEANRRGYHTILCDYQPDNPGQHIVDEFYLISTTDVEKVLSLAQEKSIDSIVAYGSDPAALTAAYVSDKMNLKGNSPQSVELLTHKDLFRRFQSENNYSVPEFIVLSDPDSYSSTDIRSLLPAVVKPVDGSDTKGVTMVKSGKDLFNAIKKAFHYSRCGRIIIEEEIDSDLGRLHGDGFLIDGEFVFCELGDHIFTSVADPLKPSSSLFPSTVDEKQLDRVKNELELQLREAGYKNGPVNIEAHISSDNVVYIMEMGPRNAGGYIPQAIYNATGFNLIEALFDYHQDKKITVPDVEITPTICFTLHSNEYGIYEGYEVPQDLKPHLVVEFIYKKPGDLVEPYSKPGSSVGSLIFEFDKMELVNRFLPHLYSTLISGLILKNSSG